MQKLRYPGEYEVVFVDDGSTDHTQESLSSFPKFVISTRRTWVFPMRVMSAWKQRAERLSSTPTPTAKPTKIGSIIFALALTRGGYVGMGGPNLIPDEGSWVADCVGLSPGGPTHVMIDDREAEHVPGCNMGFYKWALKQINGFDPQFRKAGDDVDVIWRLQEFALPDRIFTSRPGVALSPQYHQGDLKQQRGYGEAEAMLKFKHPDHFNTLGASHWRGKIMAPIASAFASAAM